VKPPERRAERQNQDGDGCDDEPSPTHRHSSYGNLHGGR
jgi:hypothetical protein